MLRLLAMLIACVLPAAAAAQAGKSTPPPRTGEPKVIVPTSGLPREGELIRDAFAIKDSAIVFKQAGGGNLAVGILFGALGVMANAQNIRGQTEEQGKAIASFFEGVNAGIILRRALDAGQSGIADAGLKLAEDANASNAIILTPFVYVRADPEGMLRTSVTLQAELGGPGKREWLGRYHHHSPLMMKAEDVQSGDPARKQAFVQALDAGAREALELFYQDAAGRLPATGKSANVISMYLANIDMRRMQIAYRGELVSEREGQKIIRHDAPAGKLDLEVFGVHVFRDAQIMKLIPLNPN
jgi:hypothetical protein